MVTRFKRNTFPHASGQIRLVFFILFCLPCVFAPASTTATAMPDGEIFPNDFRISYMGAAGNIYENGLFPSSAYNPERNEFLVVWEGREDIPPTDEVESEIWGQRVDASTGNLVGKRMRISYMGQDGTDEYYASDADVVYNSARQEYLVVWSGKDNDADDREIFGQRLVYNDNGVLVGEGGNFLISQASLGIDYDFDPAVAYNDNDDEYLVVWQVYTDFSTGTIEYEIIGQRLGYFADSLGEIGSEDFRISQMGPDGDWDYSANEPDVGYNNLYSEYLVVWAGTDNNGGLLPFEYEIWGKPISGTGTQGATKRLSACGPPGDDEYDCRNPAVAFNQQLNQWLVVWDGDNQIGNPPRDIYEVFGQQLIYVNGKLEEYGLDDFRISSTGMEDSLSLFGMAPAVTASANFYMVVWSGSNNSPPLAQDELEIFGQFINASNGKEIGFDDFRISDMGPDGNKKYSTDLPAVSYANREDHFLVTWKGDDDTPPLVDDDDEIFGQLYSPYTHAYLPLIIND